MGEKTNAYRLLLGTANKKRLEKYVWTGEY
jgi:hypothetical protein